MRNTALGEPCSAVTLPVTCVPVSKQTAPAGTIRLPSTVTAPSAPVQAVSPAALADAVAASTPTTASSANPKRTNLFIFSSLRWATPGRWPQTRNGATRPEALPQHGRERGGNEKAELATKKDGGL